MPTLAQIRGGILEEIVLVLLENAGYRILSENDGVEIRNGHSGLELQGRGEWHQVDALVSYDFSPSFIYPIRLIVEAKAYLPNSYTRGRVDINTVRNAVGVLKDVNENYFSLSPQDSNELYKFKRFNYTYAIFSLYGFTRNAQRYAIAHQIFLIQYYFNPLFTGIRNTISQIKKWDIFSTRDIELRQLRRDVRDFLRNENSNVINSLSFFSNRGKEMIINLKKELDKIKGSYFGLLNGEYPIHLISERVLTQIPNDEIFARVYIHNAKYVSFEFNGNRLFFELPETIVEIFSKVWRDKIRVAKTKRQYVNYVTLTGKIDGIMRNLIIRLDESWLEDYLRRLRLSSSQAKRLKK